MRDHPVLHGAARFGIRLGLDRIERILAQLGDPHRAPVVVHVAGTNGKGSVVRMITRVLREAGYRVGEYTSPHLQAINERIQVDGAPISDEDLDGLLYEVDRSRAAWAQAAGLDDIPPERALTYFELMTTAAFLHFARAGVQVAVVEVGLGGRLDATNVVAPAVSVIVTVSLDHTEQLGPDLASIAAEKAGIIKPGCPVVTGPLEPAALRTIRAIAAEREAPLLVYDQDYRVRVATGGVFSWSRPGGLTLPDLRVAMAGRHQVENGATAVAAIEQLARVLPVPDEAIRRGLATAVFPGRLEWLAPDVLVDAAHNPDGARRLAAVLRDLPRDRPRTLVLGMSEGKDARSVVVTLAPHVDRIFTTRCDHPRAVSAGDLAAAVVDVDVPVLPAGPIEEALPNARDGRSLVIVAGSVFLAGAARDLLGVA